MSVQDQIYQFRICLKDISPMILRRILIQNHKTLADLHYVIQIVMGWTNYHLNEFIIHGKRYTISNQIGMPSANGHNGRKIKLSDLRFRLKKKFLYQYDFTAGWEFEIRLEKIVSTNPKKTYPTCISGSSASPEEECGGPFRFNALKVANISRSWEVMGKFFRVMADGSNSKKKLGDLYDIKQVKEACYWFNIARYERRQINEYLKFYANDDARWKEAFYE